MNYTFHVKNIYFGFLFSEWSAVSGIKLSCTGNCIFTEKLQIFSSEPTRLNQTRFILDGPWTSETIRLISTRLFLDGPWTSEPIRLI